MASKLIQSLITCSIFPLCVLIFMRSTFLPGYMPSKPRFPTSEIHLSPASSCNLFEGKWVFDPSLKSTYDDTCPFHRNSWNCIRNQRKNMARINSWRWVPENCNLNRVDPFEFLNRMRNKNIGFVGDSLNENFLVSFLCVLRNADSGAVKWKRKGAWRGAYFPKYNVTVAYHRAVLLAKYEWQPKQQETTSQDDTIRGIYRVDVDIPATDWANISDFYNILIFNTGHWWGFDKFPKETPLVFYKEGKPIHPTLTMLGGLKLVLDNMMDHIEKEFSKNILKFWRLQSPRHFHGGNWNQNGSCLFNEPLKKYQLDLWFDPSNDGVNKEARQLNDLIKSSLLGTSIRILDLTHLSEFRADAHPAVWLGKKDAVSIWGQDCMHWCLPGVPDTWVDILAQLISLYHTR